jgi:hypothetical protein
MALNIIQGELTPKEYETLREITEKLPQYKLSWFWEVLNQILHRMRKEREEATRVAVEKREEGQ